jgi:hypothetical protein
VQRSNEPSEIDGESVPIFTRQGGAMARRSRQSVLKRQRERKKAEKAEAKRAQRAEPQPEAPVEGSRVASQDDLAGYGLAPEPEEVAERD